MTGGVIVAVAVPHSAGSVALFAYQHRTIRRFWMPAVGLTDGEISRGAF